MKNDHEHRTERRKNDEDIAERISGGVRLERSSPRDREIAHDPQQPPKTAQPKRRRRAR